MNNSIYPCLWFDGQAKAAADFYCSVFENSKITATNPMVTAFELSGRKFIGLDGGPMFKVNPSISFFALCNSENEIEEKWQKLSKDGVIMMTLNKYPWNEKYGWCQDQFGVNWQLMMGKMGNSPEKIIPSFMFTQSNAGKAERAINFYTTVFKSSSIELISRYEKGEHDVEGSIKHAQFALANQLFAAMDSSGPHAFIFNEGISFVVDCDTQEEIDYYWNKLTEEGQESQCGWLKDKFGVSWQIVPTVLTKLMSDPSKSERVIQAFMKMKKFDIAKLMNA
ncbi:VOC family protein [soil metagenome]